MQLLLVLQIAYFFQVYISINKIPLLYWMLIQLTSEFSSSINLSFRSCNIIKSWWIKIIVDCPRCLPTDMEDLQSLVFIVAMVGNKINKYRNMNSWKQNINKVYFLVLE